MSYPVDRFRPLEETLGARPEDTTMAAAVCAMRKSFEAQSAVTQRLTEELEGALRETNYELRHVRLKAADYQDVAASIARSAEQNTAAVTKAVERFEAAVEKLTRTIEARA